MCAQDGLIRRWVTELDEFTGDIITQGWVTEPRNYLIDMDKEQQMDYKAALKATGLLFALVVIVTALIYVGSVVGPQWIGGPIVLITLWVALYYGIKNHGR